MSEHLEPHLEPRTDFYQSAASAHLTEIEREGERDRERERERERERWEGTVREMGRET